MPGKKRSRPELLEEARRAGAHERTVSRGTDDSWARLIPPTSDARHRDALLESLSPALREAAEAWRRR